jgi:hypothetical protein
VNIAENPLYREYPRVAPVAETFGFKYSDIEYLLNKIKNNSKAVSYFNTDSSQQTALKVIIARLGFKRDQFFEHLRLCKLNNVPDEILVNDCGRYFLLAYKALLK